MPAAKIEDVELETDQPPVEQQPELDPIGKYLQHLDEICESVEPLGHNECRLKLSDWSLRYTMELASKTRYYDEPEEERPVATMYFTLHNDHSWEINDRGETAATLAEISENAEAEMDAFRRQISKGTIALSSDGTLRSKGVNYNTFEASLLRMRESIKSMDDRWSEQVWGKVGPMPLTIDKATGKRLEFSGRGFEEKGAAATQVTRSFSLVPGAMTYYFEREPYPLSKDQLSKDQPGTVCLVRDNPGILDDEMLLAHITEMVGNFAAHLTRDEMAYGAQERGLNWGSIRAPDELVDEGHLNDRGFWVEVPHPELDRSFKYPGPAGIYNGSPWRISRRAPLIGEHNEEIYCGELGLQRTELAYLAESGVV